jgi:cellulose synthase/poly-beta-1,6-N-acetylglucosamine synthase-like glycosyltransferase
VILDFLVVAATSSLAATLLAMVPGALRAPAPVSLVLGGLGLAAGGWAADLLTRSVGLTLAGGLALALVTLAAHRKTRGWTWLAAQQFVTVSLAFILYIAYSVAVTVAQVGARHFVVWVLLGSLVIVLGELAAVSLAISYLFEILDVLGRRRPDATPAPPATGGDPPWVVLQVPMYNEPFELVSETLTALAHLDYPKYLVQVVDNNTKDPAVWMPVQELCARLGNRFQFLHLDPWPGFKAGALNEATRQLPPEVEVIAIVDADYVVEPGFLRATVPYFADPDVGFVQTPQNYRDWRDDRYLRGLYHSYRYFFDITMPARAHRNAIIFCGTMGLIRRSALEEIGGWNPDCITEDAEASLRILGRGYRGVYVRAAFGEGLMPLTFDGLKKQRFRWALGGIQILRQNWRELLPFARHELRLTTAQRAHYLIGALQWFGDATLAAFTTLLLGSAIATAAHHRLPVAQITGAVLVIPLVFLAFGLLRAVWALRASGDLTWGDAGRALRVWFALSLTVTRADIQGLLVAKARFLRTPKRRDGMGSLAQALRSARAETTLAVASILAAVAMEVRSLGVTTTILAALLLFQGSVYLCAPWASLAADGIKLTPLRRIYLNSPRSGGEGGDERSRAAAVPLGMAAVAFAGLVLAFATASPSGPQPFSSGVGGPVVAAAPSPGSAATTPSPRPSATLSPSPSPSPTASPTPSPSSGPSTSPSPGPSASPSASPSPSGSASPSPSASGSPS